MKKNSVIVLFLLISALSTKAQEFSALDTLNLMDRFKSDLEKAMLQRKFDLAISLTDSIAYYAKHSNNTQRMLYALSAKPEIYRLAKEPNKAIKNIKKALVFYRKLNLESDVILFYSGLASIYRTKGQLDSTNYFLEQADQLITDTTKINALHYLYNQKSAYYENTARLDSAIHYVFKRIAITDSSNHYKLSNANIRLSNLFGKVSDYTKAFKYINKAIQEANKSELPLEKNKLTALINKFELLLKLGKPNEALAVADSVLTISKEKERHDFEVFAQTFINKYHFNNQKTKTDHYLLNDSIIAGKKLSTRSRFSFYLTQFSQNLELQQNSAKIKALHDTLQRLLPNIGALSQKQTFYNLSSKYYQNTGDYKLSLNAKNRYLDITNQINNQQKIYTVYDLEAKYQTEKKDKEIAQKQVALEKSHAKTRTMTILIISLLLTSILLWFLFQQRQKRIQQQLIAIQKEQEVLTLESLIAGEEKERLRIAQELHDGVNGDLSAIKFKLTSLLKMNNDVIKEAVSMIDNSCQQVRAISHNLVPPSLKDFNLIEAIANYCENKNDVSKATIQYQHIGEPIILNKKIEVNIFRIIQELVTNAIKHAEANTINVQTSSRNEIIQLTVEDDGIGIELQGTEEKGIGLMNVQSRIDYLNASLDVLSNQKGTSYTIDIDTNKLNND